MLNWNLKNYWTSTPPPEKSWVWVRWTSVPYRLIMSYHVQVHNIYWRTRARCRGKDGFGDSSLGITMNVELSQRVYNQNVIETCKPRVRNLQKLTWKSKSDVVKSSKKSNSYKLSFINYKMFGRFRWIVGEGVAWSWLLIEKLPVAWKVWGCKF